MKSFIQVEQYACIDLRKGDENKFGCSIYSCWKTTCSNVTNFNSLQRKLKYVKRIIIFYCHIFSGKSAQNLKHFLCTTPNLSILALLSSFIQSTYFLSVFGG